jgi:hypothetical protein
MSSSSRCTTQDSATAACWAAACRKHSKEWNNVHKCMHVPALLSSNCSSVGYFWTQLPSERFCRCCYGAADQHMTVIHCQIWASMHKVPFSPCASYCMLQMTGHMYQAHPPINNKLACSNPNRTCILMQLHHGPVLHPAAGLFAAAHHVLMQAAHPAD